MFHLCIYELWIMSYLWILLYAQLKVLSAYYEQLNSSIVNEFIRIISIFFTKKHWVHKNANQAKTKQQNKNKLTKNNKGNNFLCIKTSMRGKTGYFVFFYWNCPDNLFAILLVYTPINPSYGELLFINPCTIFFTTFIYFFLCI